MNYPEFTITKIRNIDKSLITSFIKSNWGSIFSVSRGKLYNTTELPGFICKKNDEIIGLITYHIIDNQCEIITLDSKKKKHGLGTKLINCVINKAKKENCERIWLITTNDNINAIHYYQKRGFDWVEFHKDAMIKSRKIKPEIPEYGFNGIPIKHEIEFEKKITDKT